MSGDSGRPRSRKLRTLGIMLLVIPLLLLATAAGALVWMTRMPGSSFQGALPPLTEPETESAAVLEHHVHELAGRIGERNIWRPRGLEEARAYVVSRLEACGYTVEFQEYEIDGTAVANLIATLPGVERREEIVIVGAHYDSVRGSPGANDNASGIAAVLELARIFADHPRSRTLRFVFFVNEEPPFFQTGAMGSLRYARESQARGDGVVAMLSIETIGYYSDREKSQTYPPPLSFFYPGRGDFIAFVGNLRSRGLVRRAIREFRREATLPSEGGALPGALPGIGWSDQWSFWQAGFSAAMVTDTAPFRYPAYHSPQDRPEHIDYDRTARVVAGLVAVVEDLAGAE